MKSLVKTIIAKVLRLPWWIGVPLLIWLGFLALLLTIGAAGSLLMLVEPAVNGAAALVGHALAPINGTLSRYPAWQWLNGEVVVRRGDLAMWGLAVLGVLFHLTAPKAAKVAPDKAAASGSKL